MAFTRATGKHRRPARTVRARANITGMAGLATAGVVGSLAAPAAASPAVAAPAAPAAVSGAVPAAAPAERALVQDTGLTQVLTVGESLADTVALQASSQQNAAVREAAEAEAKERAAEARRKAETERAAAAEAAKEREAARADRSGGGRTGLAEYVAPIEGAAVSTSYGAGGGAWSSGSHTGVDFHAASGTAVRSVAAGEVVEAGSGGSYGNSIVIRHQDGTYTQYGHLAALQVSVGQSVAAGAQIALSGSTGNTSGPHLHFEARTGPDYGSDIDPLAYLRQHGVAV